MVTRKMYNHRSLQGVLSFLPARRYMIVRAIHVCMSVFVSTTNRCSIKTDTDQVVHSLHSAHRTRGLRKFEQLQHKGRLLFSGAWSQTKLSRLFCFFATARRSLQVASTQFDRLKFIYYLSVHLCLQYVRFSGTERRVVVDTCSFVTWRKELGTGHVHRRRTN